MFLPQGNVSAPAVRRDNPYVVELSVDRLVQHQPEALEPVYVRFGSMAAAKGFQIQWQAVSASLPQPVTGRLDVVVDKVEQSGAS